MDKANNLYRGEVVYFATKHAKDKILNPLFSGLGMDCRAVPVDTDQFGTFSGEIERRGSVRETLRKKIQSAAEQTPQGRLFLASEGSFGPDPILGFLPSDLESLLLWDRQLKLEIYSEYLCREPVHAEKVFGPIDDFREFLRQIQFPDHSVIVRPQNSYNPIFKGLQNEVAVSQAILECLVHSETGRVVIATDLRADQNKTRRNAILRAGQALIEKIQSQCPSCNSPGFNITARFPGLKCEDCGEPSEWTERVLWECSRCDFSERRERPDGRKKIPADECSHCNP